MKNIIKFFFPSAPEKEKEQEIHFIETGDIKGEKDVLELKLDVAHNGYKEEYERMKATEGKASIFINTTGFLATIVVGVTTFLVQKDQIDFFIIILIVITGFLTFYIMRTIIYSVKAMYRQKLARIDPESITRIEDETIQLKENIADYINAIRANMNIINRKVEFSSMAQSYYKRALAFLLIYVIALFVYAVVNCNVPIGDYFFAIKTEFSTWTFPVWYAFTTLILIAVSIVMSCIALYKVSRKSVNNSEC